MKIGLEKLVEDKVALPSSEFYVMRSSALKIGDICLNTSPPKVEDICLDDHYRVLAIKKAGFGTKSFKR